MVKADQICNLIQQRNFEMRLNLQKRLSKKSTNKLIDKEATVEIIKLPLLKNTAPAARNRRARNTKLPEHFND
jgi:hypothetical protein